MWTKGMWGMGQRSTNIPQGAHLLQCYFKGSGIPPTCAFPLVPPTPSSLFVLKTSFGLCKLSTWRQVATELKHTRAWPWSRKANLFVDKPQTLGSSPSQVALSSLLPEWAERELAGLGTGNLRRKGSVWNGIIFPAFHFYSTRASQFLSSQP